MDTVKGAISEQIQDLLKQINMNFSHILTREIDLSPLTAHQMYIMKVIKKHPKTNLTSLCNDLCLSKGAMSLTINKLVEEGYVLRKEDPCDRRNINIMISEKGDKTLNDMLKRRIHIFKSITSALTEDELIEIKMSLQKLNDPIHDAAHHHEDTKVVG